MKNTALLSIIFILFILFNCQDPYNLDIPRAPKTLTFNDSIISNDTIIYIDSIIDLDTINPIDTIKIDTITPPDSLARNLTKSLNDIERITKNAQYFKKSYNELMNIANSSNNKLLK